MHGTTPSPKPRNAPLGVARWTSTLLLAVGCLVWGSQLREVAAASPPPSPSPSAPASAPTSAEELFGLTRVWEVHLSLEPSAWEQLQPPEPEPGPNQRPGMIPVDFPYAEARVEVQGRSVSKVGIRYKGNSSFNIARRSLKKSIKLDFNRFEKGQTFLGLTKLNLNNNAMDSAQMREALAYDVVRDAGIPAARTAFAKVYLTVPGRYDREYLGLYTLVEQIDDRFLKRAFGTSKGMLLKPERAQGVPYLGDRWEEYERRYEPKDTPAPPDAARLIEFARWAETAPDTEFEARLPQFVDIDAFIRFVAAQGVLANMDSPMLTGHNYYLYLHPDTRQFHWIPWDLNEAFGAFMGGGAAAEQARLSIVRPFGPGNRFFDRFFTSPDRRQRLRSTVETLVNGTASRDRIRSRIDAVAGVIRGPLSMDRTVQIAAFERSITTTNLNLTGNAERPRGGGPEARPGDGPSSQPQPLPQPNPSRLRGPLWAFVVAREESIRRQLAGTETGYEPVHQQPFRAGGGPGGGAAGPRGNPEPGPGPGPGGNRPGPALPLTERILDEADANRDGQVNETEWGTYWNRRFKEWDRGTDQSLSREELLEGLRRMVPMPPRPGAGFGPPGGPGNGPDNPPGR